MAIGYHFVTLNATQTAERRASLGTVGFYAWLSPIVILTVIEVANNVHKLDLGRILQPGVQKPSKNTTEKTTNSEPSTFEITKRKIRWWLDEPLIQEFGSRKTLILGLSYAIWLLFLAFRGTGHDYVHLTRRFGHVAVSQLPLHYLLAIKTDKSPVQALAGLSHESVNPFHRLFGRILHVFFLAHVILYLNYFLQEGIISKVILSQQVRTGLVAIIMLQIIAVTTIPPIRNKAYHAKFYVPHIALSLLVLPTMFFHVPHTRKYIYQAAFLYVFNAATRGATSSALIPANASKIPGTNLVKITIAGPAWGVPPLIGGKSGWVPGQHVYLKKSKNPYVAKSPFTIAGLPPKFDRESKTLSRGMELVARDLGGPTTGWLAQQPAATGKTKANLELFLEGPYGQARSFVPSVLGAEEGNMPASDDSCLLVAGGVGATFTLPIYVSLMDKCASSVRFVLLAKSIREVEWVVDYIRSAKQPSSANVDMEMYITKKAAKSDLLDVNVEAQKTQLEGLRIMTNGKRPEMSSLVKASFASGKGRVSVLSCGPQGLSRALREEVGRYVMREGRDVMWHEETFGLGE